jgi:hypothetical protein
MASPTPGDQGQGKSERPDYGPKGAATGPILKSESYEVESMSLSRKRWDRLKDEAREAKMGWTELWLGAAFLFLGVAAAAGIALWQLPTSDAPKPSVTQLSTEGYKNLVLIAIFSLVAGAICLVAWLEKRGTHNADLDALIKNMESQEHDSDE